MAIEWALLAVALGAGYGFFDRGVQDKLTLLKRGTLWGVIAAGALAALAWIAGESAIGLGGDFAALSVAFVAAVLLFVAGVFAGDWVEEHTVGA